VSARAIGGLLAILGATVLGTAQGQGTGASSGIGIAVGGAATYGNLVGGDFAGTKASVGLDANVGVVLHQWQLGVGYDRTNYGRQDTDGDFVTSDVYFEPRLLFASATRRLTPYAAVRLGRAMASYEGVLGITDKATGYIAGVGVGALWSVASRVQIDAAAHYARLSHDYGTGGYADAEKGGRASGRLGVRVGRTR
jgi:hypothetical protein